MNYFDAKDERSDTPTEFAARLDRERNPAPAPFPHLASLPGTTAATWEPLDPITYARTSAQEAVAGKVLLVTLGGILLALLAAASVCADVSSLLP